MPFVVVIGVYPVELLVCQVSMFALQIGQDSSIYILEIILGSVYDVITHLICICYPLFKLKNLRS